MAELQIRHTVNTNGMEGSAPRPAKAAGKFFVGMLIQDEKGLIAHSI